MNDVERMLLSVQTEYESNPDSIWTYLNKGDLIKLRSNKKVYIGEFEKYNSKERTVVINFIYSLNTDRFHLKSGFDYIDKYDGYPNNDEMSRLESNMDYIIYLSKKQ